MLRSWDQAEARLFPLVMARPDLYQQSVSMIQLLLGYLRETCPDLPSLLAAHERGGDLVAEGLASAQAGSAAASPGGRAGDRMDEQAGDLADGDRADEQAGDGADGDRTDEQAGDAADGDRMDEQAGDGADGDRADEQAGDLAAGTRTAGTRTAGTRTAGTRTAGDRAAGDLAGAAAAWAASESGPRLDLVAAAACAMRCRELMASLAARHRLEALARAREQGETWTVAGETGSADLVPYTAYQRVEADVRTGRAVIVSIEPDETLTRAVYRLDAGHVDLVTGALRIGEQLGSYLNPDDLDAALRQARGEAEGTHPARRPETGPQ